MSFTEISSLFALEIIVGQGRAWRATGQLYNMKQLKKIKLYFQLDT